MLSPYPPGTLCWYRPPDFQALVEIVSSKPFDAPYQGYKYDVRVPERLSAARPLQGGRMWITVWIEEHLTPLAPLELLALASDG